MLLVIKLKLNIVFNNVSQLMTYLLCSWYVKHNTFPLLHNLPLTNNLGNMEFLVRNSGAKSHLFH